MHRASTVSSRYRDAILRNDGFIINKPRHTEEAHGSVSQAVIRSLRRRGYLPLEYPLRAVIDSINGYQRGIIPKVDCHRIA